MTPEFQGFVEAQLAAFRLFAAQHEFSSCRLVHYTGVETPNAKDVALGEVETEIAGCLQEGFLVDWKTRAQRLFISVQEPGFSPPAWDKVFAEQALVDVAALLRAAGFEDED